MSQEILGSSNKPKRVINKLSIDERIALCNLWQASGLSKAQFSKKHGVSSALLYKWCSQLLPKVTKKCKPLLTPVRVVMDQRDDDERHVMLELSLPNNVLARLSLPIASVSRV